MFKSNKLTKLVIFSSFFLILLYGQINIGHVTIGTLYDVHAGLISDFQSSFTSSTDGIFSSNIAGSAFQYTDPGLLLSATGYLLSAVSLLYALYIFAKKIWLATRAWGDREENIEIGKKSILEVGKAFFIPALIFFLMSMVSQTFGFPTFSDLTGILSSSERWGWSARRIASPVLGSCMADTSNTGFVDLEVCLKDSLMANGIDTSVFCIAYDADLDKKVACLDSYCSDRAVTMMFQVRESSGIDFSEPMSQGEIQVYRFHRDSCLAR